MAITAHYVDKSWTLQKRLLRLCYVPSPHSDENITEYLMKCVDDWKIEYKVCIVTLDNCSTNDAIIDLLVVKLKRGDPLLDDVHLHMRCVAHILNLNVQDRLDVIGVGIKQIRKYVAFWTVTPKRIEKFKAATNHVNILITKKLAFDCKTRWNSMYLMLETALKYKEVFEHLFIRERKFDCGSLGGNWDVTEKICKKLNIFYDATTLLSSSKYPTVNCFFREMCKIKLALTDWAREGDDIVEVMATKMQEKLDKYWNVNFGIKKCLLEFYLNRIYLDTVESQGKLRDILRVAEQLVAEYTLKLGMPSNYVVETTSSYTFNNPEEDMYNEFASTKRKRTDDVNYELTLYLEEGLEPMEPGNFDVLKWWDDIGRKYPTLQAIAKDIYAIPSSIVAYESTFSLGGRIITSHRSRLNPLLVEALACCQSWIQQSDNFVEESEDVIRNVFEDIVEDTDFGEDADATLRILDVDF